MLRVLLTALCALSLAFALPACGDITAPDPAGGEPEFLSDAPPAGLDALPQDGVQPWEQLDGAGKVAAAFPLASDFTPGRERFLEGAGVTDSGEASAMDAPAGELAYAVYRLSLGGSQPGALSLDINLRPDGSGERSEFYVAVSDYGAGHWRWLGPFSDGQLVLELAAGNYLSPLGNTFVAVGAYDRAALDIVAVGAAPVDGGDSAAPPAPLAPSLLPIAGGLEVLWNDVIASDLAGYRVHYSYTPFDSVSDPGVKTWPALEITTRLVLPLDPRTAFVAVSAVDVSGNASPLSPVASALPKPGHAPALQLSTDASSAMLNGSVTLTATGADVYAFDLDGDGVFEVSGNTSGTAQVDTTATGLIRPRVRGENAAGTAVALGSVSLIVTGNQRPVASARADVQSGFAPLPVTFDGSDSTDPDGTIAQWAWDRTGDGIYERISTTDPTTTGTFSAPGLYNAKLRVTDDQGSFDVDTLGILAQPRRVTLTASSELVAPGENFELRATADGLINDFHWDLDGDGSFEAGSMGQPVMPRSEVRAGRYTYSVEASFDDGAPAQTASVTVTVRGWVQQYDILGGGNPANTHTALINGPAGPGLVYTDGALHMHYLPSTGMSGNAVNWGAPVTIEGTLTSTFCSLLIVDGRPALAFRRGTELVYTIADNAAGSSWSTPIVVDGTVNAGLFASLALINGNPAISYYDATNTNLRYVRAVTFDGSSWGAPVYASDSVDDVGYNCALAEVDGAPAIVFLKLNAPTLARYVRATDVNGASWGVPILLGGAANTANQFGHAVVNGHPAVTWITDNLALYYKRAKDPSGASWPNTPNIIADSESFIIMSRLSVVNGIPVVAYEDWTTNNLMLARGADPNGDTWTFEESLDGTSGIGGGVCGLAEFDGHVGVAMGTFDGLNFALRY